MTVVDCKTAAAGMSKWLNDEVLVGQGRGEAVPLTPRLRSLPSGSPRMSQRRSPLASPRAREPMPLSPQAETMGKAKELFVLCDKEGKGFITKRDMQRLEGELPLSPEQLETVFESLDRENNGFLTPVEFKTGLGELMGLDETELSPDGREADRDEVDWSQDPTAATFVNILMELGADKIFRDRQELFSLWSELQRDSPEVLSAMEALLVHAVSHLQDAIRERDCLEQALRRRESEHDTMVRSIYEEMESQIREEKEKWVAQDSFKEKQRGQQLKEELRMREQELENTMSKQKELETRIRTLNYEQTNIREQNLQLRRLNSQLQEQVKSSREQLQSALRQLSLLQASAAQEQMARQRNVTRVSRNIKKEKESLSRQLEILRDMNRRLRDEKDAQQSLKMNPNIKSLQKRGSILSNYFLQDKPVRRQLNSSDELELTDTKEVTDSSKTRLPPCKVVGENVEQMPTQTRLLSPQRVFKVVFLGNSGVGKTSFIQHYCTGHYYSKMSSTVGVDFQMKTLILNSTTITLQLWDTAGQERYCSITEQYYRKADGILALYDMTHPPSFCAVRGWMDSVKDKMCEGTVLMLLGNKLDLADNNNREVTRGEGERLAEHYQALFHECSAKTGDNMDELMVHLAEMLVTKDVRQCPRTPKRFILQSVIHPLTVVGHNEAAIQSVPTTTGTDRAGFEPATHRSQESSSLWATSSKFRMEARHEKKNKCGTICLKYLLFLFNICFWLGGGAVLAVGVWTLVDKSDYISLLNSSFYSASAYILIAAGAIVIVTGIIGCCATLKEMRSLLIVYLVLLLCIFLLEITAGVLAYINYQECFPFCHQLDNELRQNLKLTMQQKYQQPGQESITQSVDKLQQEFKCCGSQNFSDWTVNKWIQESENLRRVPDSCCKTPSELCGRRDHPSNIYRVEGGCIEKLENFVQSQLYILGAVGIGIAFLQLVGMMFTYCLCRNLKEDLY
ncbi:hypothetical protein CHARACLAT_002539 [Characodon lateralis]|uniref:EF-hand domain-containing protein n=1 Tax=Characodon lateralis TaxID=208331 RepID=A0ABU7CWF6_9TELE|nr:hypothetical protein [Characodon lateralis]